MCKSEHASQFCVNELQTFLVALPTWVLFWVQMHADLCVGVIFLRQVFQNLKFAEQVFQDVTRPRNLKFRGRAIRGRARDQDLKFRGRARARDLNLKFQNPDFQILRRIDVLCKP